MRVCTGFPAAVDGEKKEEEGEGGEGGGAGAECCLVKIPSQTWKNLSLRLVNPFCHSICPYHSPLSHTITQSLPPSLPPLLPSSPP